MDIRPIGSSTPPGPVLENNFFGAAQSAVAARPAAAPLETARAVQQPASPKDLEQAVRTINAAMQASSQNLEFTIDKDTNMSVVKIVDTQTKEVIRQLPSEETLEIAKSLDKVQGLLIRQKA